MDLYKTENILEDGERSAFTLTIDNMEYLLHHAHCWGGKGGGVLLLTERCSITNNILSPVMNL
jgi:hypothetical protein